MKTECRLEVASGWERDPLGTDAYRVRLFSCSTTKIFENLIQTIVVA